MAEDKTTTSSGGDGGSAAKGGALAAFFKGRKGEAVEAALSYILGKKKKTLVKWLYGKFPWLSSPQGGFFVSNAPLAVMLAKVATNNENPITRNLESLVQDFAAELEEGFEEASGNRLNTTTTTNADEDEVVASAVTATIAKEYEAMGKFSVAVSDVAQVNVGRAAEILEWYTDTDPKLLENFHRFILAPTTTKEGLAHTLAGMDKSQLDVFVQNMPKIEKWADELEVIEAILGDTALKDLVDQYMVHVRSLHDPSFVENYKRFLSAVYNKTKNKTGIERLMGYMSLTPPMPEQITALLGVSYKLEEPKKLSLVEVVMGEGKTIDDANDALDVMIEHAQEALDAAKERWQ